MFFRATACEIARGFDVTGYVRNLPDGRVELVAEGTPDTLDAFITAVTAAKRDNIDNQTAQDAPATGEFRDFDTAR